MNIRNQNKEIVFDIDSYQYPWEKPDDEGDYDANWLMVKITYSNSEGSQEYTDPCLLSWELCEVLKYCCRQYRTAPDYPWNDNNAVLRHADNNKWYGLIMTIDGGKLGLSPGKQVEIMNVKCDPVLSSYLRRQQGFYPAHHMNKENWISILLAGSENDETIKNLIDWSYQATAQKKSIKNRKA